MIRVPSVSIIILNWNRRDDILDCLKSVHALDYPNFQVIVVDNASMDDSVAEIRRRYPRITILHSSQNLGFAEGNNKGIRHAMSQGADYFWLLNNDATVQRDSLSKLVGAAEDLPSAGLLSPVIYYYHDPAKIQFPGSYADWQRFSTTFCSDEEANRTDYIRSNMVLWGTALLMSRKVVRKIGLLQGKYFAYEEDTDYCLRANKAGFKNYVHAGARVYHKDSVLKGSWKSPSQAFLRMRNNYFVWMDHCRGRNKIRFIRYYLARLLMDLNELRAVQLPDAAEAALDGAWNGFLGIGGAPDKGAAMPRTVKRMFYRLSEHPSFWNDVLMGNWRAAGAGLRRRLRSL